MRLAYIVCLALIANAIWIHFEKLCQNEARKQIEINDEQKRRTPIVPFTVIDESNRVQKSRKFSAAEKSQFLSAYV